MAELNPFPREIGVLYYNIIKDRGGVLYVIRSGCGILLYVKNNMTATLLTNYTLRKDIEALFVEIVIGKIK